MTLTRVQVIDTDGQLAGLFFTRLPLDECRRKMIPLDFKDVAGEWVVSGGSDYRADGENAWYLSPLVILGNMEEVNDGRSTETL